MTDAPPRVHGSTAPGFEPVRHVFEENLKHRGELGAACAAYLQGEKVVDLWGGFRDRARTAPRDEDTCVLMFSASKGIAAATMAHSRAQGLFDYDDRVADHWPEFGQNGKVQITVRQLLAHQAGLAAIDGTLTPDLMADHDALATKLAAKAPDWMPGLCHGYHAWSLGWYESELLRRTDPKTRTLGAYFSDEIARPLGLDFQFGNKEGSTDRLAEIQGFGMFALLTGIGRFPWKMLVALANPWSISSRALSPFRVRSPADLNDPPYRDLEIPAGGGIGRVRDVAMLFGDLAADPGRLGVGAETVSDLSAPARMPSSGNVDVVLKTDTAFSLGFWKPTPHFPFGSQAAFGAPGAGGAMAFADPAIGLGFAYAPNRMGTALWDDSREVALRVAVRDCADRS